MPVRITTAALSHHISVEAERCLSLMLLGCNQIFINRAKDEGTEACSCWVRQVCTYDAAGVTANGLATADAVEESGARWR